MLARGQLGLSRLRLALLESLGDDGGERGALGARVRRDHLARGRIHEVRYQLAAGLHTKLTEPRPVGIREQSKPDVGLARELAQRRGRSARDGGDRRAERTRIYRARERLERRA